MDFLVTQSQRSPISEDKFLAILGKFRDEFVVQDGEVSLLKKPEPVKEAEPEPKVDKFKKCKVKFGDEGEAPKIDDSDQIQEIYEMVRKWICSILDGFSVHEFAETHKLEFIFVWL